MSNIIWRVNKKTNNYYSLRTCALHGRILVFYNLNSIRSTHNEYIIYEDTLFS